jgi:hypothetical protein
VRSAAGVAGRLGANTRHCTLQSPAAFSAIADPAMRSRALFTEAPKVLTHPRCVNCHPATDRPLQATINILINRWPRGGRPGQALPPIPPNLPYGTQLHAWRSVEWFLDHVGCIREECGCVRQVKNPRSHKH